MSSQLEFAVGASVIVVPQYGIPLLLASAAGKFVLYKRKRKTLREATAGSQSKGKQQVSLQWSHVSCSITTKSGEVKQLLNDQSAVAKPNRWQIFLLYVVILCNENLQAFCQTSLGLLRAQTSASSVGCWPSWDLLVLERPPC